MKFTLERHHALAAIGRVTGVVSRNSNVAILNNVAIVAEKGRIVFRATDLDMEATATCAANVTTEGRTTVDADKLRQIIAAAAQGSEISFELGGEDDPRLFVKSGRSKFRLPVIEYDVFPTIPDDGWTESVTISASDLSEVLTRSVMSASTEVTRYYLCGVYLHIAGGRLRAVATNGHHLTYRDGPKSEVKIGGEIVPTKAVTEILKAIKDVGGDVTLSFKDDRMIGLETADVRLRAKVVDGKFPDYKRVIPSPPENVAVIDSDAVSVALRRAIIASEDKIRTVIMDFAPGSLTVRGRGQVEALDEVEIEYDGPETTLAFNSSYVTAILDQIDGAAEIRFGGAIDHTTWRGVADNDGLTVLLPIRA